MSRLPSGIRKHLEAHVELYRRDPDRAHLWDSAVIGLTGIVPTLLLTTKGRRSGAERQVTLQYFRPQGRYVVVGSKGGAADHPDWYKNLLADPACTIQIGRFASAAVARMAADAEYATLWTAVSTEQPEYRQYQARTERRIPIVVFELPSTESVATP